jgi:hypothetical protein
MNGSNGNRSYANRRGDALDGSRSNVASGDYSWQTRFEKVRGPSQWPTRHSQIVSRQLRSHFDESFRVERNATTEPSRIRNTAGHDENVTEAHLLVNE